MEKILVVQLSRMGDLVQTLPLLKRLKQEQKDCEITLMCIQEFSEIIRNSRLTDRLIYLPLVDVREVLKPDDQVALSSIDPILKIPELREDYDFVINLTHTLGSGRICERVNGRRKAGRINAHEGEIRLSGDWAKYLFASSQNRTQNLFNLVDMYVGMAGVPQKPVEDYLEVAADDHDKAHTLLKSNGYKEKGRLIAFQMGANKLHRAWPAENFVSLANQLIKRTDVEIVLLGSEKEREIRDRFLMGADFPVINLIGKTGVSDLPAIIKQCDLFISNDTGPIHIASAVRTKVLGLYFSTAYFSETAPYGAGNVIAQAELPCSPCHEREMCEEMECRDYLSVEAVSRVAEMMLDGKNGPRFDFPNLSVYQSGFLSNGTLVYAPISSTISDQYQSGFVNRMMWEAVLGLEHDRFFVDGFMPRMRALYGFNAKVEKYKKGLNYLKEQHSQGIKSAREITREFSRRPIDQTKILSIADQLGKIEANVSKLDTSLGMMKNFHNIAIMDIDLVGYPEMAVQFAKKYRKLLGFSETFLSKLDKIAIEKKPLTSIIILTYNQLSYTKLCVDSIIRNTSEPFELIFVDNGSVDGTRKYLEEIKNKIERVKIIVNDENIGFALGNNQAFQEAGGEYILLLNNDVIVGPGWLSGLQRGMEREPTIGLVGPRSNYVAGVQLVEGTTYENSVQEIETFCVEWARKHWGDGFKTDRIIGFCMLVKREVIEKIGGIDWQFSNGNFGDDDFCLRACIAGFEIWVCNDIFIHHFGSRTFIGAGIDYREDMLENWQQFKEKWGISLERKMSSGYFPSELINREFDGRLDYQPLELGDTLEIQMKRKRKKDKPGPSISLCMIVKNEEKFLPQCLDSVKDHVDEMIIVDTGSTDRTVEIAESYGAMVYHHPWENNFSKHRNQSISYATGDWLLILDADEEIDKKTVHLLRDAVRKTGAAVVSVIVKSYLDGKTYYNETISPRLFKNGIGFHYVGFVHNQPHFKGKPDMYPVVIWHYGYDLDPEKKEKKHQRSIKLLLEQARRFPDDTPTRHHLSMTYFAMKEWEKAAEEAKKTIELVDKKGLKDDGYSWTYYVLVGSLLSLGRVDEAEEWARTGLQFYDKSPDLFFWLTEISFQKKNFAKVIEYGKEFFRLKKLIKENPAEFGLVVFETVNREWKICRPVGYAYFYLKDKEKAIHFLKEAVRTAPDSDKDALRQEIGLNCIRFKEPQEAIYFLEGLPEDKKEYREGLMALCSTYEELNLFQQADALYQRLQNTFPEDFEIPFKRGLALMHLGNAEESGHCFEKSVELNPGHVESLINWGLAFEDLGDKESAVEKYRAALALEPDSPKGNLNIGLFYFKQADYARATGYLEKSAADFAENVYLCLALSRAYLETGEIEAMVGTCEKALRCLDLPSDFLIESIPQVADLFLGIAGKLLNESRFKVFDLAFEIAVLLGPATGDALTELAQSAFGMGEYERAAKILEAALAIDPESPENLSLVQMMTERLSG